MKRNILTFCIVVLALPLLSWAQEQEATVELTPWWNRPVVRNLGLSEDQLNQIRTITRESRDRLIQLRAAVRSAEAALADEFSAPRIDNGSAEAAIERVVAARAELMRATSQMSLKIRQILTYAQWQELRNRQVKRARNAIQQRQRPRGGPAN